MKYFFQYSEQITIQGSLIFLIYHHQQHSHMIFNLMNEAKRGKQIIVKVILLT